MTQDSRALQSESTRRAARPWLLWVACALVGLTCLPAGASAQSAEQGGRLLMLVTETRHTPEAERPEVSFWWSNPTDPQWTPTDKKLRRALGDRGISMRTPGSDVRISRIYRTPDLSIDNASALASILGTRRVVVGEVDYRPEGRRPTWGLQGVRASADLKLVDTSSVEPKVLRQFTTHRTVYARDRASAVERARGRVTATVARLLGRTLAASSGPVGRVDGGEPALRLHGLEHGLALERVLEAVRQADVVEAVRVAWAAEGVIAVEINPGEDDGRRDVDYAGRVLANHKFNGITLKRRTGVPEVEDIVFDATIGRNFEPHRRPPSE